MIKTKILHLPKTGGTVLKSTLVKNYTIHNRTHMPSIIDGVYFCNHTEIHKNDNHSYIFIVRDPIDRFYSHFNYFKHGIKYDTAAHFVGPKKHKNLVSKNINDFVLNPEKQKFESFMFQHKNLSDMTQNIDEDTNNIIMVGAMETLSDDFDRMKDIFKLDSNLSLSKTYTNRRPKNITTEKLTDESKVKLREIFDDEYQSILKLVNLGYLPEDYLNKINF